MCQREFKRKKAKHCCFHQRASFCGPNDLTCQLCQWVALLSSMVGHMIPCGWQQTQTVYFACTAKRLRLGSPFLFSQWKEEIDGYHLCGIALFERYQPFRSHHRILYWANKHTSIQKNVCVHFISSFIFIFFLFVWFVCCRQEVLIYDTVTDLCAITHSSYND